MCAFSCDGSRDGGGGESLLPPLPASLSGLPALPTGARLADSFLTALVRLCRLEELPLTVLALAGYRTTGAAADVDGTDEVKKDRHAVRHEETISSSSDIRWRWLRCAQSSSGSRSRPELKLSTALSAGVVERSSRGSYSPSRTRGPEILHFEARFAGKRFFSLARSRSRVGVCVRDRVCAQTCPFPPRSPPSPSLNARVSHPSVSAARA